MTECNMSWKIVKYCILSEVYRINTVPYSTVSPQIWCIKSITGWFTHLLARFCKVNLSNTKDLADLFSKNCFSGLIYCDQRWLLFFGCKYKSTRWKMFHSKITYLFPPKPHECALKLTDCGLQVYCLIKIIYLLMGASLFSPGYYILGVIGA